MKGLKLAAAVAFLSGIAAAYAAERTIGQKGKAFSEKLVSIKKGDTLVFVNDDNIAHNVMSITPNSKFNLGLIHPGHSTPVTFKNPGDVQVMCAIHPTMKMIVKVAD